MLPTSASQKKNILSAVNLTSTTFRFKPIRDYVMKREIKAVF